MADGPDKQPVPPPQGPRKDGEAGSTPPAGGKAGEDANKRPDYTLKALDDSLSEGVAHLGDDLDLLVPGKEFHLRDPQQAKPAPTPTCTCNSVCTCVPVATCPCDAVCKCDTVAKPPEPPQPPSCSCVGHTACSCVGHSSCSCVGHSDGGCSCNTICTCVGKHYWRPN